MLRVMPPADLWIGHDLFGLWVAASLQSRHGGGLVYDSHELFLETENAVRLPRPGRVLLARLEASLARRADVVITVNPSIAEELQRRYGVLAEVIMNVPRGWRGSGRDRLRETLPVGSRSIVMYHGALSPGRGIEELVAVANSQPSDRVVVLLGSGPMFHQLRTAADTDALRGALFVQPAVSIEELPDWVASADVGVVMFRATNCNNYLAAPNKLFDYLVSGVPVVTSDFPEMRRLVAEVDGGVACKPGDPAALAQAIDKILVTAPPERAAQRARLGAASRELYSWTTQAERLLAIVESACHAH